MNNIDTHLTVQQPTAEIIALSCKNRTMDQQQQQQHGDNVLILNVNTECTLSSW